MDTPEALNPTAALAPRAPAGDHADITMWCGQVTISGVCQSAITRRARVAQDRSGESDRIDRRALTASKSAGGFRFLILMRVTSTEPGMPSRCIAVTRFLPLHSGNWAVRHAGRTSSTPTERSSRTPTSLLSACGWCCQGEEVASTGPGE
jgi:hypothetical protein